jgi:glyoxylate reductase
VSIPTRPPITGRPRVAVTRSLPGEALDRLAEHADLAIWPERVPPSPDALLALGAGADGLVTMVSERIDGALLDALPNVRVVSNMAVGVDNIDLPTLTSRGIPVGHTPGVLTDATADLAFALLLATARRVVESHEGLLAGAWLTWQPAGYLGLELAGSTLGIVGTGAIGRAVIRRAQGFGMQVVATSRTERQIEGVTYVSLGELLARSDVVSLHVALTPETHHLIGTAELAQMRPGAFLINTARGAIVDQSALYAALASGHLGGAGLDVYEIEPVPLDEPLLSLPNCVTLPHIGSATVKTRRAMAELVVDNVLAGLRGERLIACANPEVYRE